MADGRASTSVYPCSLSRPIERIEKQFFRSLACKEKRGGKSNNTEKVGKQMHKGKPRKLHLEWNREC